MGEVTDEPCKVVVSAKDLLKAAVVAACERDPVRFFELLYETHLPDGLIHRLGAKWPRIGAEVEDIVSDAIRATYEAAAEGRRIVDPGPYIFKTADNMAADRDAGCRLERAMDPEQLDLLEARPRELSVDGTRRDDLRVEAIRRARALLPRLGHEKTQQVMGYLMDAVEAGRPDVPNQELVDVFGFSPDTVRQCKSRGWRRLARVAQEQGVLVTPLQEDIVGHDDDEGEPE
jgi:DNA-directed RNA polymerase specialized sigma24 family protein